MDGPSAKATPDAQSRRISGLGTSKEGKVLSPVPLSQVLETESLRSLFWEENPILKLRHRAYSELGPQDRTAASSGTLTPEDTSRPAGPSSCEGSIRKP